MFCTCGCGSVCSNPVTIKEFFYNGDADVPNWGKNDEAENVSCVEFKNGASTLVISGGFKLTTALVVYAYTFKIFVSHAIVNFSC